MVCGGGETTVSGVVPCGEDSVVGGVLGCRDDSVKGTAGGIGPPVVPCVLSDASKRGVL